MDLIGRYARSTHTDGVVEAGIEYVHQIGSYSGAGWRCYDVVFLHEIAAENLSGCVLREDIA